MVVMTSQATHRNLAECDQVGAVYTQGCLIIQVIGTAPTPQHTVRIVKEGAHEFALVLDAPDGVTMPVSAPYVTTDVFLMPAVEEITIHHRDGATGIAVTQMEAGPALVAGGGEIPTPYRLSMVATAPDATEALLPIQQQVEAVGYSEGFSFDEAFRDAVRNLPADPHSFPDKMLTIRVTDIGAITGGVMGVHKMYVKVATAY